MMGPENCFETSVLNQPTLHNNPENARIQIILAFAVNQTTGYSVVDPVALSLHVLRGTVYSQGNEEFAVFVVYHYADLNNKRDGRNVLKFRNPERKAGVMLTKFDTEGGAHFETIQRE
jgi:hypothetical protein